MTDTVQIFSDGTVQSVTSDKYFLAPCYDTPNDGYLRLVRTWGIIDWSFFPPTSDPIILPALDLDNDGRVGDPYSIIIIGNSIYLNENNVPTLNLGKRGTVYEYDQEFLNEQLLVHGTVFLDSSGNCVLDTGEPTLGGWSVKGIGQPSNAVYTTTTDGDGYYELAVCPQDTLVEVSLDIPGNFSGDCPATFEVAVASGAPGLQDIPALLNQECALLSVDIATGNMRPCFNGAYAVNYCNLSGTSVDDAYPGLVNLFPVNTPNPFTATFCRENTSSYDPNDKQAYPSGYPSEHFIKRNTDIEYMIRFQNTGTDTAFTVVLLDTLSAFLDAASVRPGASSHVYDFDLLENNILRFRFDNILLPDSNVNEAASNGFVKFRVQQQPDNPLGTVIRNSAAIYFDFNAPVITNEAWHTVGENFVTVSTNTPNASEGQLLVFPNPANESATFQLLHTDPNRWFVLLDGVGKPVATTRFAEATYRFERGNLPAGIYFFQVVTERGIVSSGKIVLQ